MYRTYYNMLNKSEINKLLDILYNYNNNSEKSVHSIIYNDDIIQKYDTNIDRESLKNDIKKIIEPRLEKLNNGIIKKHTLPSNILFYHICKNYIINYYTELKGNNKHSGNVLEINFDNTEYNKTNEYKYKYIFDIKNCDFGNIIYPINSQNTFCISKPKELKIIANPHDRTYTMEFEDNIDNQNIILNNLPKIIKVDLIDYIHYLFIYNMGLLKLYSDLNIKI